MFHWLTPVPPKKKQERIIHIRTGESKNFVSVKEYAEIHDLKPHFIYTVLIPKDRVEWRKLSNGFEIDKRYPPFLYSKKKK